MEDYDDMMYTSDSSNDNFIKYIESKFQEYYIPNKNISIDEAVIKFKGKIGFITYNKTSPLNGEYACMYYLTLPTHIYIPFCRTMAV